MNDISIYDEVSFPSYPHALSHPQRLATIARMRGLVTPSIDRCRVLELGCGAGGNLIPMAETLSASEFLGIDLSPQQIAIANQLVQTIGRTNVRFIAADFVDLNETIGAFDFIICHGVYSWTTDPGREKIFELCSRQLSTTGIAYINYNTFPGWHVQGMLRDMLRSHCEPFADPAQKVRAAREMIAFLLAELNAPSTASTSLLRDEVAQLTRQSDAYLFHAYLNVKNRPFYLHEVVHQARNHGLEYVGDAEPQAMWPEAISSQSAERVRKLAGQSQAAPRCIHVDEKAEQYYDFVRFSMSRRSLFCRGDVQSSAVAMHEAFRDLHLSLVAADRAAANTSDSRVALLLRLLSDVWPESRPWTSLREEVERQARTHNWPSDDDAWMVEVFQLFVRDVLQFSVWPNIAMRAISTHPQVTAFARHQAAASGFITNLRHQAVNLNPTDRATVQLLDGRHSVSEISTKLSTTPQNLAQSLERIARASLLVG